uniref:Uncharacterized protein n=1 Tax=Oryza meridionalis TaxID=40149 RepID=A0A0E0FA34_9ORYZ
MDRLIQIEPPRHRVRCDERRKPPCAATTSATAPVPPSPAPALPPFAPPSPLYPAASDASCAA